MKKILIIVSVLSALAVFLYSQANTQDNSEQYKDSATTGQIDIQTFTVEDFDDSSSWIGSMPRDMGIIRVQRREGGPGEVKSMENNKASNYCMGTKVAFFKTGANWFSMAPPREMPIKGVSKQLQVWACGRNLNHKLSAIVRDVKLRLFKIPFGKLNFPGWQKMSAQINNQIDQENYMYVSWERPRGLSFKAMLVECAMRETHGIYYLYLDELTATSDLFLENPDNVDQHDMIDNW